LERFASAGSSAEELTCTERGLNLSQDGREALRGVVGGDVVDVAHRHREVGVAHIGADLIEPVGADGPYGSRSNRKELGGVSRKAVSGTREDEP
jgi:hypothetical protein